MMLRWVLTGIAMVVFLGGCASDERRARINFTLSLMDQTTTQLKTIKEKIAAADDKMIADKELDLSEAVKKCEELKDWCKKNVQKHFQEIQASRLLVSDAEKAEFKKEFDTSVNQKELALGKATLELDTALKKLEADVKNAANFNSNVTKQNDAIDAVEKLKKTLGEAQAEFESLNRKG